jgi:ubiquinone/menaquinone biosynthesis C-methylase UbiE
MTAVDISPTFVRLAREQELREPLDIDYRVASALRLPFADRTFDFVVAFMSLMDIPDLDRALREANRVLREAGFLLFAMTHPCYDTPVRGWVRDEEGRKVARQCGGYFQHVDGELVEWLFSATPPSLRDGLAKFKTPRFFRTLSTWVNALFDAGFVIEQFQEPRVSDETLRRVPDFADAQIVPLWLNVRCRKPAGL